MRRARLVSNHAQARRGFVGARKKNGALASSERWLHGMDLSRAVLGQNLPQDPTNQSEPPQTNPNPHKPIRTLAPTNLNGHKPF